MYNAHIPWSGTGVGYLAELEGRSSAQAAARSIHHIWWQRWDPSLAVVQRDPWIQNECGDGTDRGLRRKAGSISKSGRPGSRLEREVYSGTQKWRT